MAEPRGATDGSGGVPYWQTRPLLVLLVLATAVPLLLPTLPPLIDLPGHLASYHIAENLRTSAELQRYYDMDWELAGNLGVNLLIRPLGQLFGLEPALKLIVIAMPMLVAAGLLAVARELHGRVPPTALFALPLAYHHAFQFGFLNFSLSAGLCFMAFWAWLRLGRAGQGGIRAALFVPLACLLWLTHAYGWGMLGILVFAAQAVERRRAGATLLVAAAHAALDCLPLCLPILLMLLWPGRNAANTGGWFEWPDKAMWIFSILRERWQLWDMLGAALLLALTLIGVLGRSLTIEPRAKLALLLLFLVYMIMPRVLIGSGYADMRLAAFVIAVGLIGLQPPASWSATTERLVAAAALLFLAARLAATTVAFLQIDRSWTRQLAALDHIRPGSRVLVLDDMRCLEWSDDRLNHISSLAVVRRNAFTNGQFTVAGALVDVTYKAGEPFVADPSHLMRRPPCPDRKRKIPQAIAAAPLHFDYLWLVGVPRSAVPRTPGLIPIWQGERGLLLRAPAVSEIPTAG